MVGRETPSSSSNLGLIKKLGHIGPAANPYMPRPKLANLPPESEATEPAHNQVDLGDNGKYVAVGQPLPASQRPSLQEGVAGLVQQIGISRYLKKSEPEPEPLDPAVRERLKQLQEPNPFTAEHQQESAALRRSYLNRQSTDTAGTRTSGEPDQFPEGSFPQQAKENQAVTKSFTR